MNQSLILLILNGELENTSKKMSIGKPQLYETLKILDWRGILVVRHIVIFSLLLTALPFTTGDK